MSGAVRRGLAAPLPIDDVNTDLIIRSRDIPPRLGDDRGQHLFACWREDPGAPFVLDRPEFRGATILLAGANFGCGSSREAAVWALRDAGFEAVVAPSFGAIFFSNCVQNQVVPVALDAAQVGELGRLAPVALTVDVDRLAVDLPDGRSFPFRLRPVQRLQLASRRSAVELIHEHAGAIADFERHDRERRPWAYPAQD